VVHQLQLLLQQALDHALAQASLLVVKFRCGKRIYDTELLETTARYMACTAFCADISASITVAPTLCAAASLIVVVLLTARIIESSTQIERTYHIADLGCKLDRHSSS
jgi:hypothetical protein